MEFEEVVRRRRMTRNYLGRPVAVDVVDRVLDAGRRAPTAGWSQGVDFLALEGAEQTEAYWSCTFAEGTRDSFRWPGLFRAPVLVLPLANARAYLDRYSEPDKAASGLGQGEERWPVPFWLTDAAMAAQNILLAAVDEGLGALFFGIFSGEDALRRHFAIPAGIRPIGTIALGWPDTDELSRSLARPRRSPDEVIHRGHW